MDEQPKEQRWMPNPNWVRAVDGNWIHVCHINEVYITETVSSDVAAKWEIVAQTPDSTHTLVRNFESKEAAQKYMDSMQMFYIPACQHD